MSNLSNDLSWMPTLEQIRAEQSRRSLHMFLIYFAWPALNPGIEFKDNWHIKAICDHLEAVHDGRIKKLLINMPPRMLKSTIIAAFCAWEWIDKPHLQYITAGYSQKVAIKESLNARKIIQSAMYQKYFGNRFTLSKDQNEKDQYTNSEGGARFVTSPESAGTGFGGNRIIFDDLINAMEADSPVSIAKAVSFLTGTLSSRRNSIADDVMIGIGQRFNTGDPSGYILANNLGWDHLVLPMRYEAEYTKTTSIGFKDPRTEEGEILDKNRFPEKDLKELERDFGSYHVNAQLQQRPDNRGGNIFNRNHWKYYKVLPELEELIISADCTFKDLQTSDYVAIQVWGRKGPDMYLLHRVKQRLGFAATVQAIRTVKAQFPKVSAILIEDKANGSAVIETLKKELPGILAINPEGGKIPRAYAIQYLQEAGNLYLPDVELDPTIEVYLTELSAFPTPGVHDDEVDSTTQAVNWFKNRVSTGADSYFTYLKGKFEDSKKT